MPRLNIPRLRGEGLIVAVQKPGAALTEYTIRTAFCKTGASDKKIRQSRIFFRMKTKSIRVRETN